MNITNMNSIDARSGTCDSCIIFLHGYGASGNDLISLTPFFAKHLPNTVFLSPDAPDICTANPSGFQWFPISWIDGTSPAQMEESFLKNMGILQNTVEDIKQMYALKANRVVLVGFSQGTMVALHLGLRHTPKLGGIVGFSGRLLFPERLEQELQEKPDILLVHGDQDDVVDCAETDLAEKNLLQYGVPVEKHISQGVAHSIASDGLQLAVKAVRKWLA